MDYALLVLKPAEGVLTLTLLLMGFFTVKGVFRIATSILRMREEEEQRRAAALEGLRLEVTKGLASGKRRAPWGTGCLEAKYLAKAEDPRVK